MACQVIISDEVFSALNAVVLYPENRWSKKEAINFLTIFYEKVDTIAKNPSVGRKTIKNPAIRKILITKHNMLYYEVTGKQLALLSIFFMAQNPEKNKLE